MTMPSARNIILPVILVLSVLVNIGLGLFVYVQSADIGLLREELSGRQEERNFLLDLIPQLKPHVSKGELRLVLTHIHPSEDVNDVGDHIQWRLFQFWFNKRGYLETVRWSS